MYAAQLSAIYSIAIPLESLPVAFV